MGHRDQSSQKVWGAVGGRTLCVQGGRGEHRWRQPGAAVMT